MSKITSYPKNHFPQKSFDRSVNLEEVIRQNEQLKQEIEVLLSQNSRLREIINQLSKGQQDMNQDAQNIYQKKLQNLTCQVIKLQEQLQFQRKTKNQTLAQSENDAEQTIKVIEQLSKEFQSIQNDYQKEVQTLQKQLQDQKHKSKLLLESVEQKINKTLQDCYGLAAKLKAKDDIIAQLKKKLYQISQSTRKQLKISTTIQELRQTLERQIEQKQKNLKIYEELVINLRSRLIEN